MSDAAGANSKLAAGSCLSFYITFSPEGVPGDVAAARLRALVLAQVPATARGPGTRWSWPRRSHRGSYGDSNHDHRGSRVR